MISIEIIYRILLLRILLEFYQYRILVKFYQYRILLEFHQYRILLTSCSINKELKNFKLRPTGPTRTYFGDEVPKGCGR